MQVPSRSGPVNDVDLDQVLALLPGLPIWPPAGGGERQHRLRGARRILEWLESFPGDGWQQRWVLSGADTGVGWLEDLRRKPGVRDRSDLTSGLGCLLSARVVLPSYDFLAAYRAMNLFIDARRCLSPTAFTQLEETVQARRLEGRIPAEAVVILTKLVLHTGRELEQITAEDFAEFRIWSYTHRGRDLRGTFVAWDLLATVTELSGPRPEPWERARLGQRSPAELVDRYRIQNRSIRDLLVRYLSELEQRSDHSTMLNRSNQLVSLFWVDLEAHHPGLDSLRLSPDMVSAWKRRLGEHKRGGKRAALGVQQVLITVRAFYLDLAEWAIEDPSWAPWVVPCPIPRRDTANIRPQKQRAALTARMHQRVRDRLPHLLTLAETAQNSHAHWAAVLTAAQCTEIGAEFSVSTPEPASDSTEQDGASAIPGTAPRYRRVARRSHTERGGRSCEQSSVTVQPLPGPATEGRDEDRDEPGERIDVVRREDKTFWAWAVIETLRHTGLRVEELLELTELALSSYRLPPTGEVVPLLQVLPSKIDEERLLLVSPELASVLASIVSRLRADNDGRIPVVSRWDHHERVYGPVLPHLFQRRAGPTRQRALTRDMVHRLLQGTVDAAGLRGRDGEPLRFTPHDFRRMFATEAVTTGLPVHIAARLLGHHSLNTTQSYLAVFDEELIRTYRTYLDRRRAVRPSAEYREPTPAEWAEFEQHFERRALELGSCARPYGTPCSHEHACLRCPMQRVDPRARQRLVTILANLTDRIDEARVHGWLGELEGLEHTLRAGQAKLAALDRSARTHRAAVTDLGMPTPTSASEPAPGRSTPSKETVR
ncbi:hypothetical protein FRP1_30435 (plasmid) [Pseudonocardia sp. EC080625-04]|nr:hypothetical protein FRP1_30435 [Pseudonocardia sp. EC080625-04]